MNITFLIGNGFDLNLDMKTRFSDFYDYYVETESTNNHVVEIKETIKSDLPKLNTWADLELALGKYCEKLGSIDIFDIVLDDIKAHLALYLNGVENAKDFSDLINSGKFSVDFAAPEKYLEPAIADEVSFSSYDDCHLSVITFNYTRCLENIINYPAIKGQRISTKERCLYYDNVFHVHGYANDSMILGVNSIEQIDNAELRKNPDVATSIVKPICNDGMRTKMNEECERVINDADVIYIFGLSLGESDKKWWDVIVERMCNSNCKVIVFWKNDKIGKDKRIRAENSVKKFFFDNSAIFSTLEDTKKEEVRNKMHLALNTKIFSAQ